MWAIRFGCQISSFSRQAESFSWQNKRENVFVEKGGAGWKDICEDGQGNRWETLILDVFLDQVNDWLSLEAVSL